MKIRFQVRSRALDASRIWHDFSIGFYYDFRQEQKYYNPRFYIIKEVCTFLNRWISAGKEPLPYQELILWYDEFRCI